MVIVQREDSLLGEDYIFFGKLELVFVVLHCPHDQVIQEAVLLDVVGELRSLGQGQRKLPRKQQLSLCGLRDFL